MPSVGPWELLEAVGEGNTSLVWKARDPSGRLAALKILRDQRLDDEETRSRLRQEVRILAALDHPNIARLLDSGEVAEEHIKRVDPVRRVWLALEWVEGVDLAAAVGGRPLEPRRVFVLGRQIAFGLGAAHERAVVHRDLSPANVRVTPADEIKLVDFGLAKVLSEHSPSLGRRTMVTAVGSVLGTAPWMAPEQFSSKPVDARTDIHALGALLYYLAVGRQPFEGRNLLMVMQAIEAPERPRPGVAGSRCGEVFDALVTACLARDPAGRPQSATEVARVLDDLLREAG